jgi:hypothetical protein
MQFPDVVAAFLALVRQQLQLPTGTRVPAPRPSRFIVARRVGGERMTPITEATRVMFEAWAGTPEEADSLAGRVRNLAFGSGVPGAWSGGMLGRVPILRVEDVSGPADQPDELSDQPRATFTLQYLTRAVPITEDNDNG